MEKFLGLGQRQENAAVFKTVLGFQDATHLEVTAPDFHVVAELGVQKFRGA